MATTVFEADRVSLSGGSAGVQNAADSASVSFSQIYDNPVVVAHIATNNGGQFIDTRAANVSGSGCDVFQHEPDQEGHMDNTATYFVAEEGVHETPEGHTIEAGTHQTKTNVWDDPWNGNRVEFENDWNSAPVVVAMVNTHNNGLFASVGISNVTKDGFDLALVSEDAENTHIESVGWIAFPDKGAMTLDGVPVEASSTSSTSATFSQSFGSKPDYVADSMAHDGSSDVVRGGGTWSSTDISWYDEEGGLPSPYGYVAVSPGATISGYDAASFQSGTFSYRGTNPKRVGHWPLDGTTAEVWKSSQVTAYGTSYTTGPDGRSNGATHFDSANPNYIAVDTLDFSGTRSQFFVAAWIRTTEDGIIISHDRSEHYRFTVNGGNIGFTPYTDGGQVDLYGNTVVTDGEWHFVLGLYDNGTVQVWVDAELDAETTSGSVMGNATTRYGFIGTGSEASSFDGSRGPNNWFGGDIAAIQMANRAPSSSKIQELYEETPKFGYDSLNSKGNQKTGGGHYAGTIENRGTVHTPPHAETAAFSTDTATANTSTTVTATAATTATSLTSKESTSATVTASPTQAGATTLTVDPYTASADVSVTDGVLASPKRGSAFVDTTGFGSMTAGSTATSGHASASTTAVGMTASSSPGTKTASCTAVVNDDGSVTGADSSPSRAQAQTGATTVGVVSTTVTPSCGLGAANATATAVATAGTSTHEATSSTSATGGSTQVAYTSDEVSVGDTVALADGGVCVASAGDAGARTRFTTTASRTAAVAAVREPRTEFTTGGEVISARVDSLVPFAIKEYTAPAEVVTVSATPTTATAYTETSGGGVAASGTESFGVDPLTAATSVEVTDGMLASGLIATADTSVTGAGETASVAVAPTSSEQASTVADGSVASMDTSPKTVDPIPEGVSRTVVGAQTKTRTATVTTSTETTVTAEAVVSPVEVTPSTRTTATGSTVAESSDVSATATTDTTSDAHVTWVTASPVLAIGSADATADGGHATTTTDTRQASPHAQTWDGAVVGMTAYSAVATADTSAVTGKVVGSSTTTSFSLGPQTASAAVANKEVVLATPAVATGQTRTVSEAETSNLDALGQQRLDPKTASVSVVPTVNVEVLPLDEASVLASADADGNVTAVIPTVRIGAGTADANAVVVAHEVTMDSNDDAFAFTTTLQSSNTYDAEAVMDADSETSADYEADTRY